MKHYKKIFKILAFCYIATFLSFTNPETKIIIIDAGHGGKNYGATEGSHYEKEILQQIAKQIALANEDYNLEFYVFGEEDIFNNLEHRANAFNSLNPDLLISLHLSSSADKLKRGAQTYIDPNNANYLKSKKLAENLLRNLNENQSSVIEKNVFILKNVNCPAVSLEIGYLSNKIDQELLLSEEGQRQLGRKILKGLSEI